MKTKLLLFALILTGLSYAQTTVNLSGLTQNTTLGSSCSGTVEHFKTTGDLNLNGFTINLQNATLEVVGNINGGGSIIYCGNSVLCSRQSVQNNPNIQSGLNRNCNSLSIRDFIQIKYLYNKQSNILTVVDAEYIEIYDITGRLIINSNSNIIHTDLLQGNILYVIKTDIGNIKLYK